MKGHILDTVKQVDQTFLVTFGVAAFFFLLIVICLVVFVIRYNHKKNTEIADIRGNNLLEVIWIVIPTIIVMGMFYSGWQSYLALRTVPGDAMPISVTARQWSWTFTYANDRISNILYVPVNTPVKLTLKSLDVIHSFYAPAFRIKRDAVPGMTTYVWFLPDKLGEFDVLCTEYCGVGHSAMLSQIKVLPVQTFNDWYAHGQEVEQVAGTKLFVKHGCIGCHQLGEANGVGPKLEGLYQREVTVNTEAGENVIVADEAYLKRSILAPNEETVVGYPPIMPSYKDKIPEEELDELIEFIKSLKPEGKDSINSERE